MIAQPDRSGEATSRADLRWSPKPSELHSVLVRNIHLLERRRAREKATATLEERIASAFTRFAGSMRFVYLHFFLCIFWITANFGQLPGVPRFDPNFMILAVAVSVVEEHGSFLLIRRGSHFAVLERRAGRIYPMTPGARQGDAVSAFGMAAAMATEGGLPEDEARQLFSELCDRRDRLACSLR